MRPLARRCSSAGRVKRRIPQRLEDRPPRSVGHRGPGVAPVAHVVLPARHGDGDGGGGGGGGGGGSVFVVAGGRRWRFRRPPRVPFLLLLLRFLLIFIVIVIVVVVGFRGWNGVAVGPSPPVFSPRQELHGGLARMDALPGGTFPSSRRSGAAAFAGESAPRGDDSPDAFPAVATRRARAQARRPWWRRRPVATRSRNRTLDASTSSSRTSSSVRGRWSERELHAPQNTTARAAVVLNPGSDPGNSRSHP